LSLDDNGFDLTQEPKKVFVNLIIWNMKIIETQIYFSGIVSAAVRSLRGLIGSLSENSQKKLESQLKQLKDFSDNGRFTSGDIEEIYQQVSAYLHKTYLAEVNRGIIPSATLNLTAPNPKAKKYPKTLSAAIE
jgi:hypothetical protein